jgi:hypothetical protein
MRLLQPITGGVATPSGRGYWLVAADGGIFSFGDAGFAGSDGGGALGQPVAAMAATGTGRGYWLAGSAGRVGAHGDAAAYPAASVSSPVVGIAGTASGRGYWLATSTGAVLSGNGGGTGTNSYAFLAYRAPGQPVRYDPCGGPIAYVINARNAPAGGPAEVQRAFATLARDTGLSFRFAGWTNELHAPGQTRAGDGYGHWRPVLVSWEPASREPLLAGAVLGYGGSTVASAPGYDTAFVTGEVVLDTDLRGVSAGFGPGTTRGNLVLHELGHLVGLQHVPDPSQLMYATLTRSAPNGYAGGDANGLRHVGAANGCLRPPPAPVRH